MNSETKENKMTAQLAYKNMRFILSRPDLYSDRRLKVAMEDQYTLLEMNNVEFSWI